MLDHRKKTLTKHASSKPSKSLVNGVEISPVYLDNFYRLAWKYSGYKREYDSSNLELIIKRALPSIAQIWDSYNCDRQELSRFNFNTPKYSFSYLVGFHLPNVARVNCVFKRLLERIETRYLLKFDTINIWDIGCGTGALSSSFISNICQFFNKSAYDKKTLKLNVNLIDRASHFLSISSELIETYINTLNLSGYSYNIESSISTTNTSIESFLAPSEFINTGDSTLNVYLAGYVYNEISSKQKGSHAFERLISKINSSKNTLIFLLDPANQTPAKKLIEFKDKVLKSGFNPLYPCPFLTINCPLSAKKDWCYTEGFFKKDRLTDLVDKSLKTQRSKINTCAFVLTNTPSFINSKLKKPVVVVGKPIIKADRTQSHIQYLLCDGDVVYKKECLNKDSSLLKGELYLDKKKKNPISVKKHKD